MYDFDLTKPIKSVSGAEITTLHLDFEALSFADLRNVYSIRRMIDNTPLEDTQNDVNFQLGIAWTAAIKGKSGVTLQDILQVEMNDCFALAEVAQVEYLFRGKIYSFAKEKYKDSGNIL